jgi:omega-amidase
MQDLKVTLIQSDLFWEDTDRNLEMFSEKINAIHQATDLIVLPEMFNTGFTMNTKDLAEKMHGKTMGWMQRQSRENNCVLTGSMIVEENGNYYNRLLWIRPDGSYESYDKRHLFRMAGEENFFTAGNKRIRTELKGWRICPLVCYDLRFPVWSRNKFRNQKPETKSYDPEYDLLIYVANWPERRSHPWKTLLMARAIENQAYVIGLNRVGNDGNGIFYSGDSSVVNFKGETISEAKAKGEFVETLSLQYTPLEEFRKTFPVGLDGDEFTI